MKFVNYDVVFSLAHITQKNISQASQANSHSVVNKQVMPL